MYILPSRIFSHRHPNIAPSQAAEVYHAKAESIGQVQVVRVLAHLQQEMREMRAEWREKPPPAALPTAYTHYMPLNPFNGSPAPLRNGVLHQSLGTAMPTDHQQRCDATPPPSTTPGLTSLPSLPPPIPILHSNYITGSLPITNQPQSTHSIVVANQTIHFNKSQLNAPPSPSYSSSPQQLLKDWESYKLCLHPGTSAVVGIKYWRQLYRGSEHWERLKKHWSCWAVSYFILLFYVF